MRTYSLTAALLAAGLAAASSVGFPAAEPPYRLYSETKKARRPADPAKKAARKRQKAARAKTRKNA